MSAIEIILSRSGVASMLSGLLEGVGVPWPGALVLTAAGADLHGTVGAVLVALCFGVLYTASSWVQYMLGRYCWHQFARFLPRGRERELQALMRRYGQFAVLWTRPLAVGNFVSIPAGMVRMHQGKFLLYTFLGIMPWALAMTFGGRYLGAHLADAGLILTVAAVLLAAVGGFNALRKRGRSRRLTGKPLDETNLRSFAD